MALADAFVELGVDQGRLDATLRDALAQAVGKAQATATKAGESLSDGISRGLRDPFTSLPINAGRAGGESVGIMGRSADTMSAALSGVARPGIFDGLLSAASAAGSSLIGILGDAARSVADVIASTLSTAFQAAGAALGVLGTAIVATGVGYNSLVQRSLAAFTTMLGSAEQARDMLEQITVFARQSPFPRQIFIAATQELLGFGLAAEKIIPTFSAIQDAVAATGGTGEDIASISHSLAQAIGVGRITGDLLQQLGMRGIDASKLIASAMGGTPEAVKEALSKGEIPLNDAMDALVAGMTERFGGGAALVKEQFVGAVDRIKGAFRDVSSALVTPFIDPMGGGAAVVWANQLADMIRFIEKTVIPALVVPLRAAADVIGTWVTKIKEFVLTITTGGVGDFMAKVKEFAPILVAAGAGFIGLATGALQSIPILGQFLPAINPIFAALLAFGLATPAVREALGGLVDELRPVISTLATGLAPVLHSVMDLFAQIGPVVIDALGGLVTAFAPALVSIVTAVADLAGPLVAALLPVISQIGAMFEQLAPVITAFFDQLGKDEVMSAVTRVFQDLGPIFGELGRVLASLAPLMVPIAQILGNIVTAGADLLSGLLVGLSAAFGAIAEALGGLQPLFDAFARVTAELAPVLGTVGAILGDALATAFVLILEALVPLVPILAGAFSDIIRALAPVLPELATALGQIAISFAKLLVAALPIIPPLVQLAVLLIEKIGAPALVLLAEAVAKIAQSLTFLEPIMVPLVVAFLAFKTVMLGLSALTFVVGLINAIGAAIGFVGMVIAANPIGAIVIGIVALGAAVYLAYQNFEPFRNVVDEVGRFLRDVFFATIEKGREIWERFQVPILAVAAVLGGPILAPLALLYIAFQNLETIVDVVLGVFETGVGIISRWLAPIIDMGRLLKDLFTDPLGTLEELPGRVAEIISDTVGALTAFPTEVAKILVGLGGKLLAAVGPSIAAFATNLPGWLLTGLETLGPLLLTGLVTAFDLAFKAVLFVVIQFPIMVLGFILELPNQIVQALVEFGPTLLSIFVNAFLAVITAIPGLIEAIIGFLVGLPGQVLDALSALAGILWDSLVGAFDAAKEGVITAIGAIVDEVIALPGQILALGPQLLEAGGSIIGKIFQGITDILGAATGFAADIGRAIANGVIGFINDHVIDAINNAIPDDIHNPVPGLPNFDLPDNPIPHIPTFELGGYNRRLSLALLHPDELILPLRNAARTLQLARESGLADMLARDRGGPASQAAAKQFNLTFPTLPADATLTPERVGTVIRRIEALAGG